MVERESWQLVHHAKKRADGHAVLLDLLLPRCHVSQRGVVPRVTEGVVPRVTELVHAQARGGHARIGAQEEELYREDVGRSLIEAAAPREGTGAVCLRRSRRRMPMPPAVLLTGQRKDPR